MLSDKATAGNSGTREIRVEVVTGGRSGAKSALVVWDNGKGMDAKGLQDYATYFLTQVCFTEVLWATVVTVFLPPTGIFVSLSPGPRGGMKSFWEKTYPGGSRFGIFPTIMSLGAFLMYNRFSLFSR